MTRKIRGAWISLPDECRKPLLEDKIVWIGPGTYVEKIDGTFWLRIAWADFDVCFVGREDEPFFTEVWVEVVEADENTQTHMVTYWVEDIKDLNRGTRSTWGFSFEVYDNVLRLEENNR